MSSDFVSTNSSPATSMVNRVHVVRVTRLMPSATVVVLQNERTDSSRGIDKSACYSVGYAYLSALLASFLDSFPHASLPSHAATLLALP